MLETIRDNKKHIKSIIIASSDKAYGDYPKKDLPYREDYHLKPRYPYDVSKACADMISKAYTTELFNLPIIITRFSNIYGPGQLNFSPQFPEALRCIIKNKKFIPRSDGKDFRDFIFIKDIVDVYLLLARKLYFKPSLSGEVFNAGNNKPITVKNLLQKIYFQQNKKTEYLEIVKLMKNKNTTGEIKFQSMNYRKLNKFFRWKPKYNIEKSLNITFAWYRKYLNK